MLNVVIAGSSGRMGHALLEATLADAELKLHAALDRDGSPHLGRDAGELFGPACGVNVTTDSAAALQGAHVLVDFTRPEASMEYLAACRRAGVGMVIGTTGFSPEQKQVIAEAAKEIPVVFAPNMSVGVNLLINLVQAAAKVLAEGYDIEIIEAHHRHKVDAPSGTALRLGEAAAAALGRNLVECAVYGREGVTGERDPSTIGFATVRGRGCGRRPYGAVCGYRRARRVDPQGFQPGDLCAGRAACRQVHEGQENRLVRHARCARADLAFLPYEQKAPRMRRFSFLSWTCTA